MAQSNNDFTQNYDELFDRYTTVASTIYAAVRDKLALQDPLNELYDTTQKANNNTSLLKRKKDTNKQHELKTGLPDLNNNLFLIRQMLDNPKNLNNHVNSSSLDVIKRELDTVINFYKTSKDNDMENLESDESHTLAYNYLNQVQNLAAWISLYAHIDKTEFSQINIINNDNTMPTIDKTTNVEFTPDETQSNTGTIPPMTELDSNDITKKIFPLNGHESVDEDDDETLYDDTHQNSKMLYIKPTTDAHNNGSRPATSFSYVSHNSVVLDNDNNQNEYTKAYHGFITDNDNGSQDSVDSVRDDISVSTSSGDDISAVSEENIHADSLENENKLSNVDEMLNTLQNRKILISPALNNAVNQFYSNGSNYNQEGESFVDFIQKELDNMKNAYLENIDKLQLSFNDATSSVKTNIAIELDTSFNTIKSKLQAMYEDYLRTLNQENNGDLDATQYENNVATAVEYTYNAARAKALFKLIESNAKILKALENENKIQAGVLKQGFANQIKELESTIQNKLNTNTQELNENKNSIFSAQKEIKNLKTQNKQLTEFAKNLSQNLQSLRDEFSKHKDLSNRTIQTLRTQIQNNHNTLNEAVKNNNDRVVRDMANFQDEVNQELRRQNQTIADHNLKLQNIDSKLTEINLKIKELEEKIKELEEKIQNKKQQKIGVKNLKPLTYGGTVVPGLTQNGLLARLARNNARSDFYTPNTRHTSASMVGHNKPASMVGSKYNSSMRSN